MKLFTRSILAAVALSVIAVPMAQAQSRYDGPRHGQNYSHPKQPNFHSQQKRYTFDRRAPAPRHHWSKGKRLPEWQRRQAVRDYHRHGLKRPGRGQQWVKVDNDYLLVTLASGIIAGIVSGR
jgi:Ni/Co efflux regulator RcnB